jgi:peroxiredoxin
MYDRFEALGVTVIAVAQEDKDLESHGRFRGNFKPQPRFEIVADLERTGTEGYDRTSTYLIDRTGVVRQVFPNLIHHRASWSAILHETDRLLGGAGSSAAPQPGS